MVIFMIYWNVNSTTIIIDLSEVLMQAWKLDRMDKERYVLES